MKASILFSIGFACLASSAQGQYYYKDIISNAQLQKDLSQYKENKIRTIQIESFESDGLESPGFYCRKKINRDYTRAELLTRIQLSGSSWVIATYDKAGKITSSTDSSKIAVNKIIYQYNADGLLENIYSTIRSADDDFVTSISEEHIYTYNADQNPEQMLRIQNGSDTSVILFGLDDKNNVAIEKNTKTGNKYYYYFNDKSQLSEIVEVNDFRTTPTPNYVFMYNQAGQITQMTVVEEGGSIPDFFVWKYGYENGMIAYERCYSKERKLVGSVAYTYK